MLNFPALTNTEDDGSRHNILYRGRFYHLPVDFPSGKYLKTVSSSLLLLSDSTMLASRYLKRPDIPANLFTNSQAPNTGDLLTGLPKTQK